jgi:hypothetical protein
MPPVGFEPTILAGERPQTYALDGEASGTGKLQSKKRISEFGQTQVKFTDAHIFDITSLNNVLID